MDDNKIDDLLSSYSESLGHFTGPVPMPAKRTTKLWKPIAVTAMGSAIVAGFVFMPRKAEAAPMDKMVSALRGTTYWKSIVSLKRQEATKWDLTHELVYCDGKFKSTSAFSSPHTLTTIIDADYDYDDFKDLPYILKTKSGPWFISSAMTDPMSYALRFYVAVKDWSKQDSGKYHGVETYEMRPRSAKSRDTVVITVEKSTNLPLLVRSFGTDAKKHRFDLRQEYSYTRPNPTPVIAIDPRKSVLDAEQERKAAIQKWDSVDRSNEKPIVFESHLGKNGSVWVIFAYKNFNAPCWVPKVNQNGYRLGTMFSMSSYGKGADYFVHSHEIVAYYFVPTTTTIPRPTSLNIDFELKPMFGGGKPSTKTTSVPCALQICDWNFPRVFAAFCQQVSYEFLDERFYNTRAHAKLERKEYASAAADFESEFRLIRGFKLKFKFNSNSAMSEPLWAAAECYEKMGNLARAKELRKQIPSNTKAQH